MKMPFRTRAHSPKVDANTESQAALSTGALNRLRQSLSVGILATLLLSLAVIQPGLAKELYKWTDEKGVLHYTDKPPRGVEAEKITKKGRTHTAVEDDSDEAAAEQQKATASKLNKERCEAEKKRLQVLSGNQSIRMKMEDGTSKVLSPEEIAEEIAFAQEAIDYFCQ